MYLMLEKEVMQKQQQRPQVAIVKKHSSGIARQASQEYKQEQQVLLN
jgi:hypothetical protein